MDFGGLGEKDIHRPYTCEKCRGRMNYVGVGEYVCESCGHKMYDDYGKVRNYLEMHRGANQTEVSMATGVTRTVIRHLLREDRLEVAPNSAVFLTCEACGTAIRSGRLCESCARIMAREKGTSERHSSNVQGFGKAKMENAGAKRFDRS